MRIGEHRSAQWDVIIGLTVIQLLQIKSASCWWSNSGVRVSEASQQAGLNGLYYLSSVYCSGYNVWIEDTHSPNYYISVIRHCNTSTCHTYWAIGTTLCVTQYNVTAYNPTEASKPYNLPPLWYELNTTSKDYVPNPQLNVTHVSYLSVGEIIGIILGCLCFGILLLAFFVFVCSRIDHYKQRRTRPETQVVLNSQTSRHTRRSSTHVYDTLPPFYTSTSLQVSLSPPAYTEDAPPSYELVQLEKSFEQSSDLAPPYSLCMQGLTDSSFQPMTAQQGVQGLTDGSTRPMRTQQGVANCISAQNQGDADQNSTTSVDQLTRSAEERSEEMETSRAPQPGQLQRIEGSQIESTRHINSSNPGAYDYQASSQSVAHVVASDVQETVTDDNSNASPSRAHPPELSSNNNASVTNTDHVHDTNL